ncbi:MAG: DUF177 domain-containing protein [Thermoleophilaceae bacterium]
MAQRVESFDIGTLGLSSGEGRSIDLEVPVEELRFAGETYGAGDWVGARLDLLHTTTGHALRLRFDVRLHGPCTRCLDDANAPVEVDAREIDQLGGYDELRSPYVDEDVVDLRSWARDALALALPPRVLCSDECRGLCPACGANLNQDPEHEHEPAPDPRWAKLSELRFD